MKVVRISLGTLGALGACVAGPVYAANWTVSFDPAAPVHTNGWDLSQSSAQEKTSQSPAGRKLAPKSKGDTVAIESPVHSTRIRTVSLAFKCVNARTGNSSKVEVLGRAATGTGYRILFSESGLPGSPTNLCSDSYATPLADFDCRQVKIAYTKDSGNLVLSSVTFEDDAIRAEPPTNLRTEVVDAAARRVRVSWDLAEGLSESEWRTFTTATAGGIGDSETLWRKSFDSVPAAEKATKLGATDLASLGLADWDSLNVRRPSVAGALLIGWDSHESGSLTMPPPRRDLAEGHALVIRAATRDVSMGVLPVSVISGVVTSHVADVAITKTPRDCPVPLPALADTDRIFVHSITNYASEQTLIYDLAICAPGAYVPESVVTNAASDVSPGVGNAAEVTVPTGGTNLWLEARTAYGGERSAWTDPFRVALADSKPAEGGGEGKDDPPGLAAPSRIRAGRLPDGRIRVGWNVPDGATNVRLRVWSVARTSGGLDAVTEDDVLWRETFAAAPATNSTVSVNSEEKFRLYTDRGAGGWDAARSVSAALATEASALKIGTEEKTGALVSKRLGVSGDGLTLVVTAKRGTGKENSGVTLRVATLSAEGAQTNELGRSATLAAGWTECAFPIPGTCADGESLLIESVFGTPKDGRALLDDIAIVRNYTAVAVGTNEHLLADCGVSAAYDLAAADGDAALFVSLAAQDADGLFSDWTEPLTIDPAALADWRERVVTMQGADVSAAFALEDVPSPGGKSWDISESPFRFLVQGEERFELTSRDAAKQLNVGAYVCTNVFGANWAVLVPGSPDTVAEVKDAECRLTIRTDAFAARRLELTGVFAQLNAANTCEKSLAIQCRAIRPDGTASDWTTVGEYRSTYTVADIAPDLASTRTNVTCAADFRLPRGATVEARVYCRKAYESGREAPLGFRDFRVCVLGVGTSLLYIVR